MPTELWKLPVPATSLVRGPEFSVLPKRQCEIAFQIERNDSEFTRISSVFDGVEAFKCTYLTSCSLDMFNTAYAKLVSLEKTQWLTDIRKTRDEAKQVNAQLQHLMICFDDGPCYEIICLDFAERRSQ